MQSVQKSRATSPATEVTAKAARRRFSAKYKKRIIDDAAACTAPGEIGALLRREGLYSSHLTKWRQQAERGELVGLEPKRRGPVPRTVDSAPAQVHAALLAEGRYLASVRTMHRILSENMEAKERRDLARHRVYERPELLATAPNQLWSWDITKLKGPAKWTYFHLYVILDVFSRYVVGWMIAPRESANLAKRLIAETCRRQGIKQSQLTLHADRGSSMKSKTVALLLADLGVTKTHSRPHISDDNPFNETQFKTIKYRPNFPNTFGCIQDG